MHHFYVSSCRRAGRSNLTDALMTLVELNAAQLVRRVRLTQWKRAQAALLQWVAVLFMIFQAPSMRSSVCRSTHPSDRSSALSKPRRTEAISPAWVTEITQAEDLQVTIRRLEDKIDRLAAESTRPFCRIRHSGIFFLKKLPITIKIRFIASPMITVTRSVTSRRSCSWTGNRYSPLRMSWWQWFVTTIVGPFQMKVRRAPPVTRTSKF
jgi:hypothetical protein